MHIRVSILEDESARFFAVSKSNSNADRNRGKTGVFLGEFIVDKPVAINNIVEEIRKFAINNMNAYARRGCTSRK